jgi:copper chaperone CopZ
MEVGELDGVESVKVDEASKKATVTFEPPATEDKIVALLKEINYPPEQLIQLS